jgi:hypothetical protein
MAIDFNDIWEIEPIKPFLVEDKYDWKKEFKEFFPTGSRYICSPPVMDTDEDWCVYSSHTLSWEELLTKLKTLGFECGGSYADEGVSFKRGDMNLIVIRNSRKFKLWRIATALAKRFNLTDKKDRVDLFEAVVKQNINYKYEIKTPEDWM